ncbi:MAG: threonylcarbamoyl-AMP synthase [Rickettsiales bacterium]|nr:threonylcarbamoyl-AMP synthase [Rickettsiales bacterium]
MIRIIKESDKDSAIIAAKHLEKGGILAFATDTIYGFGVDASNRLAVRRLYELKRRESGKAIAVLFKNLDRARELLQFSDVALSIANRFLPGPLTMIVPVKRKHQSLADNLNINDNYLGFRLVDRKFINDLFTCFRGEIALSSANLSKQDVAKSGKEILTIFVETNLDLLVVDGGELDKNLASSVVKIYGNKLEILREGVISKEDIKYYETS